MNSGRSRENQFRFRAEDRRAGIYGGRSHADRTYDPMRYRSDHERHQQAADYERNRDWNLNEFELAAQKADIEGLHRPHREAWRGHERNIARHDFGFGGYGVDSGFISGAEYGAYGRGSDYGSFDAGSDLLYGSPYGRGADSSEVDDPLRFSGSYAGLGPKGHHRSDERIREDICDGLARNRYVDAREIEVGVKDGIVTLSGSVKDRLQKKIAEGVVDIVSGVLDVQNQLWIERKNAIPKPRQKKSRH